MWSRKPTPVAALASPPSRSSESLTAVSAVLRSLVGCAAHRSSLLIIADSPWTGKPSARAIASTCGRKLRRRLGAESRQSRSCGGRCRDRAGRRSARRRRSAGRGWSRRRSRRRRSRRSGRRRRSRRCVTRPASSAASSSISSRCSGAKALARSIASLEVGDLDQGQRRVGDARRARRRPLDRAPRPRRGRPPRRRATSSGLVGAVLGLRAEVERDPLGVACRARRSPSAPRGRRSESIPTSPETARFASWTQALPGPAMTSTGAIVSVPWASAKIAWAPPIA